MSNILFFRYLWLRLHFIYSESLWEKIKIHDEIQNSKEGAKIVQSFALKDRISDFEQRTWTDFFLPECHLSLFPDWRRAKKKKGFKKFCGILSHRRDGYYVRPRFVISMSVCLSVCSSIHPIFLSVSLSIYPSVFQSLCLSICLFTFASVFHLYVQLCVCPIRHSVHLSDHHYFCLSVCMYWTWFTLFYVFVL